MIPPPGPSGADPLDREWLTDGSGPMGDLLRELAQVAPSTLPVLLLGPTGSGKELAARRLHALSGRPGPLVAVNGSALAESLLESELFGHVRGAFTGASRDRRGALEEAHTGTLFLDEVADLSPRVQALLLRVIQEREVRRVGGERTVRVDVRFVAATHRPLEDLAAQGLFRQDLFFRLQGATLRVPSLEARAAEFPFLVPGLVARLSALAGRRPPELAKGLPEALARLPWPGNVRQLLHALERALLRCGEGPLEAAHLPELAGVGARRATWAGATRDFQARLLLETLASHRFQVKDTAGALGLARPALYAAARRLGLDIPACREAWQALRPPPS